MKCALKCLAIGFILSLFSTAGASTKVKLKQISTEDGLNQSNISGLMQDDEGYLWISSLQGINRYDGYRVSKVDSPDNILLNNYIEQIFQDSTGKFWIGASPDKNFILDKKRNTLTPFQFPQPEQGKLEFPILNELVEDQGQNLWLSSYFDIFFYHRKNSKFEHIININKLFDNEDKQHSIRALLLMDNYLLIGTSNGLFSLGLTDRKVQRIIHTPTPESNEDNNNVKALSVNRDGNLLVGTVEGLFLIPHSAFLDSNLDGKPVGKELIHKLNIWKIIEKNKFYWVATDQGLYKYLKSSQLEFIFRFSETRFDTSDDDIVAMIEDREGSLWFGTRGDGVFKWRPNPGIKAHYWHKGEVQRQLSNDSVFEVHQTADNKILIGTQNGLNILDPNTGKIRQAMVNPDEKAVYSESSIYQILNRKDELWINTEEGLRIVNAKTFEPSQRVLPKTQNDIFKKPITSIHFLDENTLTLINRDGMYRYNLEDNAVSLVESTETNDDIKLALGQIFDTATGERNTYFVSGVDRVAKYNTETGSLETFHSLPQSDNFRSSPSDVYRDNEKLWVTYTGYGIYILDANTGEEIDFLSEESLRVNTVMDIFPDEHGNLWFTSNEGLLRLNKLDHNTRIYDKQDGFATSEFNGGSKLELPNGEVYIGSVKGLFRFDPNQMVNRNARHVTNRITGLSLLSKKLPYRFGDFNENIVELEHNDFGVKIEFSPLLLDKPEQVKFRYWIEGEAAVASTTINDSELFLPTIEKGVSILNISAIDYETGLESKPARLHIISKPAPWFSNFALLSYAFVILFIIWFNYYKYRKRLLAKIIAHNKLKQSEERLSLALKGGNSGLWDWHAKDNLVYEPRLEKSSVNEDGRINFEERVKALYPDDQNKFLKTWATFMIQDKKVFDIVYRMKDRNGEWAWYRDMATVSEYDQYKKPTRVTGTFTNITERKEARDKMRLFSAAFESTRDIVFVLNHEKKVIAANQSFYKRTEFEVDSILNGAMEFLTDSQGNRKLVAEIFKNIHLRTHWTGEGLLTRNYKRPLPVLINATSFLSDEGKESFVFALTDISKQKVAEGELRKLANYDTLTGLPNRALLLDRITHAIELCRRRTQQLAIFFIDLDRFKQINDTLGHDIGDLLLINVAQTLRSAIRQDDTVARLGGDEFVVVLEDISHVDAINRIASTIIEKMQEPMTLRENQISVSPSIGIAIYPSDGDEAQLLLKHADIAMYHAKNAGRNNFQYFENSMNHAAKERLDLENMIRAGIANNEFYLVFQPQYNLTSGEICGVEALARWKPKGGDIVSPTEFIPVAEDIGLIIPITEQLLESALEQLSEWHKRGLDISLAFNLSARHLHHYDFNSFIEDLLSKYEVKTHLLEFELTESILMKDMDVANRIFGKLAERGIELALDDFGTGYSSLKYLNQLPINKLKIDRSFVQKIGISVENDAIIKTIISLAQSLDLKTVAEGIETEEQHLFMKNAGVDQAQGYLFSKPITLQALEELLDSKVN